MSVGAHLAAAADLSLCARRVGLRTCPPDVTSLLMLCVYSALIMVMESLPLLGGASTQWWWEWRCSPPSLAAAGPSSRWCCSPAQADVTWRLRGCRGGACFLNSLFHVLSTLRMRSFSCLWTHAHSLWGPAWSCHQMMTELSRVVTQSWV